MIRWREMQKYIKPFSEQNLSLCIIILLSCIFFFDVVIGFDCIHFIHQYFGTYLMIYHRDGIWEHCCDESESVNQNIDV